MKIIGIFLALICASAMSFSHPFETHFRTFERNQLKEFKGQAVTTGKVAWSPYWSELVVSWRSFDSHGSGLKLMAVVGDDKVALAKWSLKNGELRTSVDDQKGESWAMYTDTLVVSKPIEFVEIIIEPLDPWGALDIDKLNLSFAGGEIKTPAWQARDERTPYRSELNLPTIEPLDVPLRAQMSYEGGNVLCSPTSLSMVLGYWAKALDRPQIDHDVPEIKACIYDKAWKGTGNWAFNTSFAASVSGMNSYVTRLRGFDDIISWLNHGVPVITSVSYDLLKGKEKKGENDGHLVVIVGISPNGEIIFNDPGRNVVRMKYKAEDFLRAWANSKNTVYLVHPRVYPKPESKENTPW